ncbi:MAG: archaetidylserine decarboxylase, partial [Polyangia bacterium]
MRERVAVDLLRWTPKGTLSRGIGWAARRRVPRPLRRALYGGFARYVGADLSLLERPLDAFERFDDFFTRPLRDGARPIAEGAGVVVSPCDGVVSECGLAEGGRLIQCKGRDYTVAGLLADAAEARAFEGGAYATIYLSPRDYHRIHNPVDGKVTGYRHIPGAFFPVNPTSVRNVAGLFSINERLVTYLDSDVGRVAVVAVAATGVGWITVAYDRDVRTHREGSAGRHGWAQRYAAARPLGRGAELGMFHLGSTVILLFEPGRVRLDTAASQTL